MSEAEELGVPRVGGYLQDPPSTKDFSFAGIREGLNQLTANFNDEYTIPEYTPVSSQGRLGSCVANSSVDGLEILMGIENPAGVVQLSRLFAYWYSRYAHGATDRDDGTYIRLCWDQIRKLGVCPEDLWPYDDNPDGDGSVFKSPPMKAIMTGNSNKVTSTYRIDTWGQERLDDFELAIRANHPVNFGTPVSKAFTLLRDIAGDGFKRPNDNEIVGRHAMLLTGVRRVATGRRQFLVRNSWGYWWGLDGHAWLDESHLDWDEVWDCVVPTRMPKLNLYKS